MDLHLPHKHWGLPQFYGEKPVHLIGFFSGKYIELHLFQS